MTIDKNIKDKRVIRLFTTLENRLNVIHKNKYDYTNTVYKGNREILKINCPIHGEFVQNCNQHLNKEQGCPKCSELQRRKTRSNNVAKIYIQKASLVHDNKYDYSKFVYTKTHLKATFICPIHGEFRQQIAAHLRGQGCNQCTTKGYHTKSFYGKDKATLYFIKLSDTLYKIGITKLAVKNRYVKEKHVQYEILGQWLFENGGEAYELEQKCLKLTEYCKYTGEKIFKQGGHTELRTENVLPLIEQQLKEYNKENKNEKQNTNE